MSRWLNWLHIKNLVEDLDDGGLLDNDFRKSREMFKPATRATLLDGKPINFEDPAVNLFFSMLDPEYNPELIGGMADAVCRLKSWWLTDLLKPGLGSYESTDLTNLMQMRFAPNGWKELDRIIKNISEETWTAKVERRERMVILNPDDPGLNGQDCYTLDVMMSLNGDQAHEDVAVGSSATEILSMVDRVLQAEGVRHQNCFEGKKPRAIYLKHNGEIQFIVPISPGKVVEPSDNGELQAFDDWAELQVDWSNVNWMKHDKGLFKVLVAKLPRADANRVKGSFLCDELGM